MTRDPLDRLRDADPLRELPLPDAQDPAARAMREAVLAGQPSELDQRRRRRRWLTGVAVAAAVATAAAVAVTTSRVQDPVRVGCYDAPSTQASTAVVQVGEDGPVATCEALWATGQIDPGVTDPADIPPLVACTLESGAVGVFPASSCDASSTPRCPRPRRRTRPRPRRPRPLPRPRPRRPRRRPWVCPSPTTAPTTSASDGRWSRSGSR